MRDAGRIAAAIEVLAPVLAGREPAKGALKDWGRASRFAGAKDRAFVSGLVLDALRRRRSVAWMMGTGPNPGSPNPEGSKLESLDLVGEEGARMLILGVLAHVWGWPLARIAEACAEEPHGPGALTPAETQGLEAPQSLHDAPGPVAGDYPDWLEPAMARVFGEARATEAAALAARAPVDVRLNTLKTTPEKALKALEALKPEADTLTTTGARIPAPDAAERGGGVGTIPAFSKGWIEVQDLGSQVAALAAGDIKAKQVLDFCAGGGGKTLALGAMMAGTGQIYAYDSDARRLSATVHRAQRAGLRTVQIKEPARRGDDADPLADLAGKMDVVFVDAPCTGSGVWRRNPDAKWRLREGQMQRRTEEQDAVLAGAARCVKPGGRLVYVTCSVFMEENEDRLAVFRETHKDFAQASTLTQMRASGLLSGKGLEVVRNAASGNGAVRLTPASAGTDGFFIAVLERAGG